MFFHFKLRISKVEPFTFFHSLPPHPLLIPTRCNSFSLDPATQLPNPIESDSQTHAVSPFPLPSFSGWSFIALHAYYCDWLLRTRLLHTPPSLLFPKNHSDHVISQAKTFSNSHCLQSWALIPLTVFKVLCSRASNLLFHTCLLSLLFMSPRFQPNCRTIWSLNGPSVFSCILSFELPLFTISKD